MTIYSIDIVITICHWSLALPLATRALAWECQLHSQIQQLQTVCTHDRVVLSAIIKRLCNLARFGLAC